MSSSRRASLHQANDRGVLRRSPRRLRTKTPSVNELSKKFKLSPKGKRRLEFKPQEPLKGKRFYLDLQCFRKSNLLVCRIKDLGGEVEDFLSKDVSYVITNRKDVDTQYSAHSPSTPSPGMSIPSPIPGTKSSSMKGPSPLSVDSPNSVEPKHDTRGKALMKKATGTQRRGTSGVLANARTWGVQLIQLDRFLEKLEQYGSNEKEGSKPIELRSHTVKQSSKPIVRKLKAPFIKVEDHSRHFKPLVHELKEWPRIYFNTPLGTCPFDPPKRGKRVCKVKQRPHKKGSQEEKQQKRGYCECCCSHYKDLDLHLRSDHHQTFARDDSNYVSLDALISRGPCLKDFLDKVREKHRKKAQGQEHDREDNLDVSSQEQTPETLSSEERRNKLLNETTPMQTPQGSELDSDESFTRVTRSRSRSQNSPDGEQTGGTQLDSSRRPLEEKPTTEHAASSVKDPSQSTEGVESHENKPEQDEEGPMIRITRSAKVCMTSASPQSVMGVPQTQNTDLNEVLQQPQKSGQSGSTVKGDSLTTASVHCSGDFVEPEIDEEPSPAEAVRVTRSKKNSMQSATSNRSNSSGEHDSGKDNTDPSECPSCDGLPEGAHDVTLHEKNQQSAIKSGDDELSQECTMPEVNPAIEYCKDMEDSQRFTKITRAKAKAFSKENGQELFSSDSNATQYLVTKNESSDGPSAEVMQQDVVVTSADMSIFGRKRSSPRLTVLSTAICAEETKEADESYSDKTESIELSQEPPNTIRTQSMQVMLKNALSGTSSSTVTIIGSHDESTGIRDPQSDITDDESIEPPREYPLRNRLVSSVKEQTKDAPLGLEIFRGGTGSCTVGSKDEERCRQRKKTVSAISANLSEGKVLDASVCHATRRSNNNCDEVAPKERESCSSSNSPRSDFSRRNGLVPASCSKDSSASGSSPRSGPTRAIDDTAKSTRLAREILEETDEEECSDKRTPVKKQRKVKRKRRVQRIILSDVSVSDSCNDSLIAHRGTPRTPGQDPDAAQVSPEPAGDNSSQKCSTPSAPKPDDVHNDQDEEWNIRDKLTLSASKLGTRKECTLSQLFNSNDDEEEFYGFDVPHFDQSLSSEQDLSFHIESIVENMTGKEAIMLETLDPISCEERCRESGERESAIALVSDCGKPSGRNDKQGNLQDAEESRSCSNGKGSDAPRPGNAPTFEQDQETGKCLNRNLLDYVLRFGKDYLKMSSIEGGENEVDVCDNGDSSSTVADSTDGEDEELIGVSPRIELKLRRRKREVEPDFDGDTEIVLPMKRRKSEDETCEQASPPVESESSTSKVKGNWCGKPQEIQLDPEDHQPQETCKEIEAGNAANNETTAVATDCDHPRYEQIQQAAVFSGQEQLNMADEVVYQTLEERVKLRRSKPTQGRETVANSARKAEQERKACEGKEVRRGAGKRQVSEEIEQNAKKSQKPAEGRRNERRMPNAGVCKNAKISQVVTNNRSTSASIVSDPRNKVQTRRDRPASRERGDGSTKRALRPLRPLRRKSEATAQQAPSVAKTVKPLKPLRPLRPTNPVPPSSLRDMVSTSVESVTFSPRHFPESSSSYTIPPRRLRSSGNWIFKTKTFASPSPTRNGKKTLADSIPHLVTPGRRSYRGNGSSSHQLRCLPSLRMGDQYEFVDEIGDVYDFSG